MADLVRERLAPVSTYRDRQYVGTYEQREEQLLKTQTVYVGNLSVYTTEEQIYQVFGMAGEVKRVVMGLDRFKLTPCGFCFVEFMSREGAEYAVELLNRSTLDDQIIKVDFDVGFQEGRQWGRGISGGQRAQDRQEKRVARKYR
ncbi:similar to nuclear cap-binding protein; CBP20 [Cyanidioschyzon merolae strain 10D]|uniref:Nuclear cap-binding protein subunit 2 n=1 Tax=Cyanidioschyzon merolae (strain NIES-3377 / 10D) TaxID=280699 RepID=M1UVT5_CYAM1|nr:similar to nuclear cap-binding protein; CBP20 [Cyanidioschyzon merolae strain 10D]BAM82161.1 similar to nuclear cap-binding protein; CBP20 [Cyanidioschyzon merolae strain 10D]|eukprot:XP_005538197.1 similar to nuclear cap-binding protein; CBP20 [Cyanidioschyzon merolae strain 10D]